MHFEGSKEFKCSNTAIQLNPVNIKIQLKRQRYNDLSIPGDKTRVMLSRCI
jgi:hypothetical protein